MLHLESKIEALLFWRNEPLSREYIAKAIGVGMDEIEIAITSLKGALANRGIVLVVHDDILTLGTSPHMSKIIENLAKEELARDLGKAGLETISMILYYGPLSRKEIDYFRGVNSQFIVRNLLIRGLIEKAEGKPSERSTYYQTSVALLGHLGITDIRDLPEYDAVRQELAEYRNRAAETVADGDSSLLAGEDYSQVKK
ncbi:MAG: hypothetical protein A2928_00755 [Candidatus Taylorbacteria bacterium RIFCSPLOWO2_01_FULL_45_15b]|uniref:SMC-Scp complex subunit ScpB n=1 Tax=Candidatus Taylorbacteria bacterium RIFCSPLOWO2_01_FULL_45_15b TaxID=1802319 RepID=A0A1G2NCI1_9BACT|nr:MAG: hypothetical protein A2928_00755 [Candidatus Taylorbacteria bacterium RIFCSPLOWO2_01_FULL_45_15b]